MKVLILGIDGYIGYPLAIHLLRRGHEVLGIDDRSRRRRVMACESDSLTYILSCSARNNYLTNKFPELFNGIIDITLGISSPSYIGSIISTFKPDAIVHLAEMPSAPWSMKNVGHASATQLGNVIGTLHLLWVMREECPNAHLIKLGTMGEYGTPDCNIPEGVVPDKCLEYTCVEMGDYLEERCECPMSGLLFPRTPGSFYHLSKVHDTHNIIFACRNWGLRSTDIMQGVVFGLGHEPSTGIPEDELTRFDYDEYFGTVINRFCAQALIDHPLTLYGKGNQVRGFLPLKDSINCLTLILENPPNKGEYRTFNQFENIYKLSDLAKMVVIGARSLGLMQEVDIESWIQNIPNPRKELEEHYYNPEHKKLINLGYIPTTDIQSEITTLIRQLLPYRLEVNRKVIMPKTKWR